MGVGVGLQPAQGIVTGTFWKVVGWALRGAFRVLAILICDQVTVEGKELAHKAMMVALDANDADDGEADEWFAASAAAATTHQEVIGSEVIFTAAGA